jgi:hypothetical protein
MILITYPGEYWHVGFLLLKTFLHIELSYILRPLVDTVFVNHKSKDIAAEMKHRMNHMILGHCHVEWNLSKFIIVPGSIKYKFSSQITDRIYRLQYTD